MIVNRTVFLALSIAATGSAGLSQSTESGLRAALSELAALNLEGSCRIERIPLIAEDDLLREWGIGKRALQSRVEEYKVCGRYVYIRQTARDEEQGSSLVAGEEGADPDAAILSSAFYSGGGEVRLLSAGVLEVFTRDQAIAKLGSTQKLARADYFVACGIALPVTTKDIGGFPRSMVLDALCSGGELSRSEESRSDVVTVKWRVGTRLEEMDLDVSKNYAVVASRAYHKQKLVSTCVCSDHAKIGRVYLPTAIEMKYYSWHTVHERQESSSSPLLLQRMRLSVTGGDGSSALNVPEEMTRNTNKVVDNRFAGYGTLESGAVVYVPARSIASIEHALFSRVERRDTLGGSWLQIALGIAGGALAFLVCRQWRAVVAHPTTAPLEVSP